MKVRTQMIGCPFCQITTGKSPALVVFENNHSMAFLDTKPLFSGHVLLVPKDHISTLTEMSDEKIGPFFQIARKLCIAVENAMNAQGSFIAINNRVSQSVPHLHLHIVPRSRGDGLRGFFWPRKHYKSEEEMYEIRDRIKEAITGL